MLELPVAKYDFARYTYGGEQEITLGYEYELTDPDNLIDYDDDYDESVKKRVRKEIEIEGLLPQHFQVNYEGFGQASGVEIKSVVAPLFLHKQFWHRKIADLPFHMEENNDEDNDSGIHVSITRTPFTEANKLKVFNFLHATDNRPSFFKISKRTRDNFNTNAPSNPEGSTDTFNAQTRCYEKTVPPKWQDHYNIINDENKNRFEFRLFAAHPTLLLPALEMCDSLFKHAADVDTITFSSWRTFLSRFKKYEHIKEHLIATLDHSPS